MSSPASLLRTFAKRVLWDIFSLFPLDRNKLVVSSYYGKGYGDNPKAVVAELLRRNSGLRIIWLVRGNVADSLPDGVEAVGFGSTRGLFQLATSGIWLDNCRRSFVRKRRGQKYMQTWHGFAMKRIEWDAPDSLEEVYKKNAEKDSSATDLMISDSSFMTRIYLSAFRYGGEIAEWGEPRNDLLIAGGGDAYASVRSCFGLEADAKLVMYAPTFRNDGSLEPYSIDTAAVCAACESRFGGKFTLLLRLHPNITARSEELCYGMETVNASYYPDMQELLAACDAVITDYSSVMFDFALTGRPCFRFATDIEAYKNDRNFYFDMDALPFPLATDNRELTRVISEFDPEKYKKELSEFYDNVGMVRDGKASERCADKIISWRDEKRS